jgi:glycerophosphoryl diester phosphodiesterase
MGELLLMDRVYRGPTMPKKRKRKLLTWKMLWVLVAFIIAIYIALYFFVVPEREDQPFFAGDDRPLVIAHRGGAEIAPENTLVAFNKAQNLGVDVIEFDVQMTSDGHLVIIHDPVVDDVTDGKGYVHRMTLTELKELDAAYYFTDVRGNAIYRGQGVTIPTVEEVFKAFPDERFNIEMKVYDAAELEDDAEAEEEQNEAQNDADGQCSYSKQT